MEAIVRPTVRVLLVDEADRVLLFRSVNPDGDAFWYPVGGGVEAGETYEQAAVREVREETGLDVALGPHVWNRRHVAPWHGALYDFRERWYLARVASFAVDTSGFSDAEVADVTAHAWWSPADLARAEERLTPSDLAERLAALLLDGPPAQPYEVGA